MVFGWIRRKFRRKEKELEEIPETPLPTAETRITETQKQTEKITLDNIKARTDLIIAELDSIKTQNQTINERLKAIEKTLVEMRGIKYY